MHRCCSGLILITALLFTIALTGCLGKSSNNPGTGGVQSVSLNPTGNLSLEVGGTQVFTATAKDALGRVVIGNIQYVVAGGTSGSPAPLSIASNGNACAGTWDPAVSQCAPGTSGVAIVTAVVNGVSSPPTTVYVHVHIDNITISSAETVPPPNDCFSQDDTWIYQARAFSNGVDITDSVGQLSWSPTNGGVLTAVPYTPPGQPNVLNQIEIRADSPGITNLFATVSGTTSSPFPFTTCLVKYIRLRISGSSGNSISLNNGGSATVDATVVDTLGFVLTKPPLTWSTTNPEVAAFSTLTNSTGSNGATARSNLGGANLIASCTPPTCNIGILPGMPVYPSNGVLPNGLEGFGSIFVDVSTTGKLPTYTAWAATTMCGNAPGCTSVMFSVTPGTTPIQSTSIVPRTPNSMMANFQSSTRIYMGSDQGLMYVDVTSQSPTVTEVSTSSTPCNVALCGKVLAISNDGKLVVVSDNVSSTHQVYLYNSGTNAVTDLVIPGVTATSATFSPDQSKIFILTDAGTMYVYSTVDAFASVPVASSVTEAAFAADASFAYVGAAPSSVAAFSTCAIPGVPSVNVGNVNTAGLPIQLSPSPVVQVDPSDSAYLDQDVYALEPPNIQVLTASFKQNDIVDGQFTCNPPTLKSFTAGTSFNLGQGNFVPIYSTLVADGSAMIVVAQKVPAVLTFSPTNGTTTAIPLVNNGAPLAASSSTDGSQVYVAACDAYQNNDPNQPCTAGSVHIIDTITQGDFQQVPFINNSTNNMCNNLGGDNPPLCVANLVVIKPQ